MFLKRRVKNPSPRSGRVDRQRLAWLALYDGHFVLMVVLFPVVWILSMSLDPRDFSRPTGLTIIPPGVTFEAYQQVLTRPSPWPLRCHLRTVHGERRISLAISQSLRPAFARSTISKRTPF
jgi:ABC-type glycerol-3-phosphate transport system permease component